MLRRDPARGFHHPCSLSQDGIARILVECEEIFGRKPLVSDVAIALSSGEPSDAYREFNPLRRESVHLSQTVHFGPAPGRVVFLRSVGPESFALRCRELSATRPWKQSGHVCPQFAGWEAPDRSVECCGDHKFQLVIRPRSISYLPFGLQYWCSESLLVQLISPSAYQPSLKEIDFLATVHLQSDELKTGGLSVRPKRSDCGVNRRFIVCDAAVERLARARSIQGDCSAVALRRTIPWNLAMISRASARVGTPASAAAMSSSLPL